MILGGKLDFDSDETMLFTFPAEENDLCAFPLSFYGMYIFIIIFFFHFDWDYYTVSIIVPDFDNKKKWTDNNLSHLPKIKRFLFRLYIQLDRSAKFLKAKVYWIKPKMICT